VTVVDAPPRQLLAVDVMSAPTVSVPPTTSVSTAWSVMMRTGLRHLLVAASETCVGVIEDRTVFAQWPMGPLALRRHSVSDLLGPRARCVHPSTPLQTVASVMVEDGVDAVPVVDDADRLLGIVTGSDIARAVAEHGITEKEST
jgi:CBS domain-containing protein